MWKKHLIVFRLHSNYLARNDISGIAKILNRGLHIVSRFKFTFFQLYVIGTARITYLVKVLTSRWVGRTCNYAFTWQNGSCFKKMNVYMYIYIFKITYSLKQATLSFPYFIRNHCCSFVWHCISALFEAATRSISLQFRIPATMYTCWNYCYEVINKWNLTPIFNCLGLYRTRCRFTIGY